MKCTLPIVEYYESPGDKPESGEEPNDNGRFLPEDLAQRIIALCSQVAMDDVMRTYDPVQNRSDARAILEEMTK